MLGLIWEKWLSVRQRHKAIILIIIVLYATIAIAGPEHPVARLIFWVLTGLIASVAFLWVLEWIQENRVVLATLFVGGLIGLGAYAWLGGPWLARPSDCHQIYQRLGEIPGACDQASIWQAIARHTDDFGPGNEAWTKMQHDAAWAHSGLSAGSFFEARGSYEASRDAFNNHRFTTPPRTSAALILGMFFIPLAALLVTQFIPGPRWVNVLLGLIGVPATALLIFHLSYVGANLPALGIRQATLSTQESFKEVFTTTFLLEIFGACVAFVFMSIVGIIADFNPRERPSFLIWVTIMLALQAAGMVPLMRIFIEPFVMNEVVRNPSLTYATALNVSLLGSIFGKSLIGAFSSIAAAAMRWNRD